MGSAGGKSLSGLLQSAPERGVWMCNSTGWQRPAAVSLSPAWTPALKWPQQEINEGTRLRGGFSTGKLLILGVLWSVHSTQAPTGLAAAASTGVSFCSSESWPLESASPYVAASQNCAIKQVAGNEAGEGAALLWMRERKQMFSYKGSLHCV